MKLIDKIPLIPLIIASILLLGAPFVPEPHSIQKLGMLINGNLTKALDIFDLFWHFFPATVLGIQLYRKFKLGK